MEDVLGQLTPYFDSLNENEEEKIDELHAVFQDHFLDNIFYYGKMRVVVKRHFYRHEKDGLPAHFSRYFEKFVHIVSRTIDNKKGQKKREFRAERANRIHWIKPILENSGDRRITCFRNREADQSIREYFWFREKDFMVILEEVLPDYVMITCFCVDNENVKYFESKLAKRI
jgi:hypothetical protein